MVELDRRRFFRTSAVVAAALGGAAALASCAPETATRTVLRVGSTTDIDSLNPFTAFSTQAYDVFQLIYDKLMDYDAQLNITPSLATAVDRGGDGKTFTYTLRSGVKWQDGKDFSADDVVFTFLMVRDNNYGTYGAYFKDLTDVAKVGDNQVRLTYSQPQTLEPGVIMPIAPKHLWESVSKDDLPKYANEKPVGTGPFNFVSWEKGNLVTVTRNDSWWGPKPAAQKVTWTKFGSDDVVTQALRTGDIDIVAEVPPTIYTGLQNASDVKTTAMESFSFHMIGFNCSAAPASRWCSPPTATPGWWCAVTPGRTCWPAMCRSQRRAGSADSVSVSSVWVCLPPMNNASAAPTRHTITVMKKIEPYCMANAVRYR